MSSKFECQVTCEDYLTCYFQVIYLKKTGAFLQCIRIS